jgi:hypothetical protein
MSPEEFIKQIREVVFRSSVDGTHSLLQKPPGRRPARELAELSQWFNGLSDDAKGKALAVAEMAARQATFGMLAVIDGVRQIEETEEKGRLELRFKKGNTDLLLNGTDTEPLHDLFNQYLENGSP